MPATPYLIWPGPRCPVEDNGNVLHYMLKVKKIRLSSLTANLESLKAGRFIGNDALSIFLLLLKKILSPFQKSRLFSGSVQFPASANLPCTYAPSLRCGFCGPRGLDS